MMVRIRRWSLATQVTVLVLLVQGLLLSCLAVFIHHSCVLSIRGAFDRSLQANAEALATLVEEEEDVEEGVELEFADEIMGGFSRANAPDLFAVIVDGKTILETSRSLAQVPEEVWKSGETLTFFNHELDGAPYRGVVLSTFRNAEYSRSEKRPVRVFFSASLDEVNKQVGALGMVIAGATLACLFVAGVLARIVAMVAMRPVVNLSHQMADIDANRLGVRLTTNDVAPELKTVGESVNLLLGRIESAFEMEKQFSADAAHELRTPIATLKSGIQAALLKTQDNAPERQTYEELLVDVERLEGLCDGLLLLTRSPKSEGASMNFADWIREIEAAVQTVRGADSSGRSQIDFIVPDSVAESIHVRCDAQSAFRIVANLAGNAVRHGGKHVSVRVESASGDAALVVVEDDGPGIPASSVGRLFERFHRVDSSRARSAGGFGLGLSICQSLAMALGGRIRFEHGKPNGCRFIWEAGLIGGSEETAVNGAISRHSGQVGGPTSGVAPPPGDPLHSPPC